MSEKHAYTIEQFCKGMDRDGFVKVRNVYDRLDRAETAAAVAILAYRPRSLEECTVRARYILETRTILETLYTEDDFVNLLLKSHLPPDA